MNETVATLIGIGVQTAIFLLGGFTMVIRNNDGQKTLARQVDEMKRELEKLATIITVQAVQTARIDTLTQQLAQLEKRWDELRRGTGWVQRERKTVDGEYP